MGILDFYTAKDAKFNPTTLKVEGIRKRNLAKLKKQKSARAKEICDHDFRYEKWIHNGPIQGKTFHYKEVCDNCGLRRNIKRTKELYELLKDEVWHKKKKK